MSDKKGLEVKQQHSVKLPYLYKEGSKILKAYSERKGTLKGLVYATRSQQVSRAAAAAGCWSETSLIADSALSSA